MNQAIPALVVTDGALRIEGMRLCAACDDVFIAQGQFCEGCERIERSLEARRAALAIPHRIQLGTWPEEEESYDDSPGAHLLALFVGWGGCLLLMIASFIGLWFAARAAVAFVLRHGW